MKNRTLVAAMLAGGMGTLRNFEICTDAFLLSKADNLIVAAGDKPDDEVTITIRQDMTGMAFRQHSTPQPTEKTPESLQQLPGDTSPPAPTQPSL